jgi:hypothetical protein
LSTSKIGMFDSPTGVSSSTNSMTAAQSSRVFYSAVVLDFISNPVDYLENNEGSLVTYPGLPGIDQDSLSGEIVSELEKGTVGDALASSVSRIKNSSILKKVPRNAIIAQVVSDGLSKKSNAEIFYPFFSPHLCMPVNPGEQVWVIYENAGHMRSMGYWICRKPADIQVDDLNYTHYDRTTLGLSVSGADKEVIANHEGADATMPDPFSFPLGGNQSTSNNTLPGTNPYNAIIEASIAYKNQFIGEPIPRFSKRAADLVLQGSNNTLISLGQNRGFSADADGVGGTVAIGEADAPTTTLTGDPVTGAGTIDIVAGRGQEGSVSAAAAVGEAIRGDLLGDVKYEEIDKAPSVTETPSNVNEGDPDFINDLSRIYVSMLTNADEEFDIQITDMEATDEGPAIVVKSSQVRLLARDDLKIHVGEADTGASVVIKSTGDIVFIPGADGVIKLGGDDADLALLTSGNPATAGGDGAGKVTANPITSTFGGLSGGGASLGSFATKILVK